MKYLIISDIHGSMKWLKETLESEIFDKLIILGDVLPHGPRNDLPEKYDPKAMIPYLNGFKERILCVQGNCDADVDQMVFEFPMVKLACVDINGICLYLTHGHVYGPQNPLPLKKGIVLYGHTHVAKVEEVDGVTYINPGSISIPKDGIHSYMVIENDSLYYKEVGGRIIDKWRLTNLC